MQNLSEGVIWCPLHEYNRTMVDAASLPPPSLLLPPPSVYGCCPLPPPPDATMLVVSLRPCASTSAAKVSAVRLRRTLRYPVTVGGGDFQVLSFQSLTATWPSDYPVSLRSQVSNVSFRDMNRHGDCFLSCVNQNKQELVLFN